MIGHKKFPSRCGGIETVVTELAPRLTSRGVEVTAYNRGLLKQNAETGSQPLKNYKGVGVKGSLTVRLGGSDAMLSSFTATLAACFGGYDIIHYHALGPAAMLPIARLFRKKTVATVHGLDWQRSKWGGFATKYLKFGEKMIARHADRIIVLSEGVQNYFRETYGRETILINNGVVPVEGVRPDIIKSKYGLEKDDFVLFLARIVPEKGPDLLIDAFSGAGTGKKLVIAGEIPDNWYGEKIKDLIKDRPEIIAVGFAEGQLLAELYSNCALYVLPSTVEGMALTLLEAMSAGARCLVSDIPENKAVVGSFGECFRCGDAGDLSEKLIMCLGKPSEEAEREAQMNYIRENYSYDAVVEKTIGVYNTL